MVAVPLLEELSGTPSGSMIRQFAGYADAAPNPSHLEELETQRPPRKLAIYPASAGYDLADELDFLSARSIESNIFFNPRFLAPAMPRLEDREVRLAVIRDGDEFQSRLRLLTPFSIERPAIPFGVPVIRTWSSPFGPLGTPLVDCDDPIGVIEDFFSMMARPHLRLPSVFVMPEVGLDGPFAAMIGTIAEARGLPFMIANRMERPFLKSDADGDAYLKASMSRHRYKELHRLKRKLGERGAVTHHVARQPDEIREGIEIFLAMEAAGWKGRERSAMLVDRYRAAFVREAAYRLAERDLCRVHTLRLDGIPIASLVVLVEGGMAYTWKTAYDESYAAFSPGTLLMMEVTRNHLEDPNIHATDSCAVQDHPVASRIWAERRPLGTLVIGLRPESGRLARQAASQLHLHKEARDFARRVRGKIRRILGRD